MFVSIFVGRFIKFWYILVGDSTFPLKSDLLSLTNRSVSFLMIY